MVWLHTPVPRAAMPRWNACQKRLWEALRGLGADRGAVDAARVLRMVGTIHSRANAIVEAITSANPATPFEELARAILPVDRAELYDLRIQRAMRTKTRATVMPEGFTVATLWEGRLTELQALREHRWFGTLPAGQRDEWLFMAANAMTYLVSDWRVLKREIYGLAKYVGCWDEAEAASRFQAVLGRAMMRSRGETVEWNGQQIDPRYRFKSTTIVERLEITETEMRELGFKHLVTSDLKRGFKRERRRERLERVDRGTYLGETEKRRLAALEMRNTGLSYREIADALDVTVGEAHWLVQGRRDGGD